MIVYEDGAAIVRVKENGAAVGHLTVEPRRDASYLDELNADEAEHLFWIASYAATALFEGLGAQGTNIIAVEGTDKLHVEVLPRAQDDGLDLFWEPKKADPADLEQVASKVKDELWYVGKDEPKERVTEEVSQPGVQRKEESIDPSKNYKLRQLRRSP